MRVPTGLRWERTTYEYNVSNLVLVLVWSVSLVRTLRRYLCTLYVSVAPDCCPVRPCPILSRELARPDLPSSYRHPACPSSGPLSFLVPLVPLMVLPVRPTIRNPLTIPVVLGSYRWTFPVNFRSTLYAIGCMWPGLLPRLTKLSVNCLTARVLPFGAMPTMPCLIKLVIMATQPRFCWSALLTLTVLMFARFLHRCVLCMQRATNCYRWALRLLIRLVTLVIGRSPVSLMITVLNRSVDVVV